MTSASSLAVNRTATHVALTSAARCPGSLSRRSTTRPSRLRSAGVDPNDATRAWKSGVGTSGRGVVAPGVGLAWYAVCSSGRS